MALIEFKNLPDTSTPLNAENLNNNFNELDNSIKNLTNDFETIEKSVVGLKGKILWKNTSLSNNFSGQNITLSSDDYDIVLFIVMNKYASNQYRIVPTPICPKGYSGKTVDKYDNTHTVDRSFDYIDATHYKISDAYQSDTAANNCLIPVYVIGFKTDLFS